MFIHPGDITVGLLDKLLWEISDQNTSIRDLREILQKMPSPALFYGEVGSINKKIARQKEGSSGLPSGYGDRFKG